MATGKYAPSAQFIYFMQSSSLVKIGTSKVPRERIKNHLGFKLVACMRSEGLEAEGVLLDQVVRAFGIQPEAGTRELFLDTDGNIMQYIVRLIEHGYASATIDGAECMSPSGSAKWLPPLPAVCDSNGQTVFTGLYCNKDRKPQPSVLGWNNSITDEWYTPSFIVEAARAAMGGIDLDPASCTVAQNTVAADMFYTKEMNGLRPDRPWRGRVFFNPPYGGMAGPFCARLANEILADRVTQSVLVIPTESQNTKWLRDSGLISDRLLPVIYLPHGRLSFTKPRGTIRRGTPSKGTMVVYHGTRKHQFIAEFGSRVASGYFMEPLRLNSYPAAAPTPGSPAAQVSAAT